MKKLVIVGLVILVIGIGFYYGCQMSVKSTDTLSTAKTPVLLKLQEDMATIPSQSSTGVVFNERSLIIEPGVGVGEVKFGMTQNEVEQVLGKPDHVQGLALEYLSKGMAIMGSKTSAVSVILFGDMNDPNSPLVQSCKYRTGKGISMGSTLEELKKAYDNPSSIESLGKGQILSYKEIGAKFTLINGKVIHMQFKLP